MTITALNLEELSKILTPDFHRDTPYADVKNWEKPLQSYYISELNVVDQDGYDSSFQYYLIADDNFKVKIDQHIKAIKHLNNNELLIYMSSDNDVFNYHNVYEKLFGIKEAYRLSRRIVALEYRALIEAIKENGFSKELEMQAIMNCHGILGSSFNENYNM